MHLLRESDVKDPQPGRVLMSRSSPEPAAPELCKDGHDLEPAVQADPILLLRCDVCTCEYFEDASCLSCASCDYDICGACVQRMPQGEKRIRKPPQQFEAARSTPPPVTPPAPTARATAQATPDEEMEESEEDDDAWAKLQKYMEEHELTPEQVLTMMADA